jgi:flagellar protein FliO/FliZ
MSLDLWSPIALAQTAGPELVPSVWRTLVGLSVVLGLLAGLAWLLRRGVIAKRTSGALSVETALPLGDRRSLVIVAVEGRRLLVGLAPNHVSLVAELQTPAPTFADAIARATGAPPPAVRSGLPSGAAS